MCFSSRRIFHDNDPRSSNGRQRDLELYLTRNGINKPVNNISYSVKKSCRYFTLLTFVHSQASFLQVSRGRMASRDDIANNRAAISNFGIAKFQPKHPAFASKDQRLRTFRNWAYDEKVSREILAEHCFISTGDADKTLCIFCDTEFQNWTKGDNPLEQHHLIYPDCPYVKLCTHVTQQRGENELQQESLSGPVTQDFISVLSPTFEGKPKGADETIEKMKADNAALRERITCVLCLEQERSVLFMPCAHRVACTKCALIQTNCPTCGKLIEGFIKSSLF